MQIKRFYALKENFDGDLVMLDADESRHLRDVVRLRSGDRVHVFDGEGNEFECEIRSVEKRAATLAVIGRIDPASPESTLALTLAVTLLKGEKTDLAVRTAVELGVRKLIPMTSVRCDVRAKDPEKRIERWRRIALEATKQCGRARLMQIGEQTTALDLIEKVQDASFLKIMFSERDGKKFDDLKPAAGMLAMIGPEGGWDDTEIEIAAKSGFELITFGGRIMKADTAATAIASILQHRFGDMN